MFFHDDLFIIPNQLPNRLWLDKMKDNVTNPPPHFIFYYQSKNKKVDNAIVTHFLIYRNNLPENCSRYRLNIDHSFLCSSPYYALAEDLLSSV